MYYTYMYMYMYTCNIICITPTFNSCQRSSGIQQTCAGSSTELTNAIIGNSNGYKNYGKTICNLTLLCFIGNRRKRTRCGDCDGCQVGEDCGTCSNCLDKPKFGGPRKKQCCIKKKCEISTVATVCIYGTLQTLALPCHNNSTRCTLHT